MKTCTKCLKTKEFKEFKPDPRYKGGHTTWCKLCFIEYSRNTKQAQKWSAANRARSNSIKANYVLKHRDAVKAAKKKWYEANKKHQLALTRKYQTRKINAAPKWLNDIQLQQMKIMYKNCPKGYHVDHIVPLQGKNVCGLHVPWNLQYLPASENVKKSNKAA